MSQEDGAVVNGRPAENLAAGLGFPHYRASARVDRVEFAIIRACVDYAIVDSR